MFHSPATTVRYIAYPPVRGNHDSRARHLSWFVRHLRNALANCRGVLGCTSPPICQALAVHGISRDPGALLILYAQLGAVIPAEAELVQIAL